MTRRLSFAKLIGRDDQHRSRLHTRRGQISAHGLVRAIISRRKPEDVPWMAPGAVDALGRYLNSNVALLELGSGRSTIWYARRAGRVRSLEPDAAWYGLMASRLLPMRNVDYVQTNIRDAFPIDERFDIAIVDHTDEPGQSRVDSIRKLATHVNMIVLDDSDRGAYAEAFDLLRDWKMKRYIGFRSSPLHCTETTIWSRDESAEHLDVRGA